MKKLLMILSLIPVLYLLIIPFINARTINSKPCGGIKIIIKDSSDYHFVTKRQLYNLVYGASGSVIGRPVKEVPAGEIEDRIKALNELKKAEVYFTIDGSIHVYVDQRNPVMRVMPDDGGDYFIDDEGIVVRCRNLYNPRLHIVGGNLNVSRVLLSGGTVLDLNDDDSVLRDIFYLVTYINNDSFWSAQIDQIYIDKDGEIDLIPLAGSHTIHMGSAENFKGKLKALETFYDKVLPEVGWNKYSVINLEFKNQIVCKRR